MAAVGMHANSCLLYPGHGYADCSYSCACECSSTHWPVTWPS